MTETINENFLDITNYMHNGIYDVEIIPVIIRFKLNALQYSSKYNKGRFKDLMNFLVSNLNKLYKEDSYEIIITDNIINTILAKQSLKNIILCILQDKTISYDSRRSMNIPDKEFDYFHLKMILKNKTNKCFFFIIFLIDDQPRNLINLMRNLYTHKNIQNIFWQ